MPNVASLSAKEEKWNSLVNYLYPCHNLPPNWSPISSPALWTALMPLVIGKMTSSQICPHPILQNLWMRYVTQQQGLLQMWLRLRILQGRVSWIIQSGFNIITWTLKNEEPFWMKVREIGRWRKVQERQCVWRKGAMSQECRQLLEAERARKWILLQKGTQPCQALDTSQVRQVSDFWPKEL